MRQVYLNGEFLPETAAKVSIFDRGFLFADAVYEVTSVLDGKLIDFAAHLKRLHRSLNELAMTLDMRDDELLDIHRRLVALNDIDEGLVYLQVTRGAADRDFLFPEPSVPKTIVLFTQKKPLIESALAARGARIVTVEDLRWRRCDIKTVQLLYPSMVKTLAKQQGADDAWMVRDGLVTEGSSNNAHIVTPDRVLVTRDLSSDILHGITRAAVLDYARETQVRVEERAFTVEEAQAAREAFTTSASGFVTPVVEIDGVRLGDGTPGPVATRLRDIYIAKSRAAAI